MAGDDPRSLEARPGKTPVLDAADWRYLAYHLGAQLVHSVIVAGELG